MNITDDGFFVAFAISAVLTVLMVLVDAWTFNRRQRRK